MFAATLADAARATSRRLDDLLSGRGDTELAAAMRHATAGGKRLRAALVLESARLHGISRAQALNAAAAVECIHAYSLVHDDLPCMDDDAWRRGQPSVHVKYGEALAVLTGDALQALAFAILAEPATAPDPERRLALIASLAQAAGDAGMVLGQAQDIAAETVATPLQLSEIMDLQANKTGALIRWSAEAGALMAGADPAPLRAYARALGLAFQIADDILDVEGDAVRAGKRLQKDAEAGKATFVSLLGLEPARARAAALAAEAEAALAPYGAEAQSLREAARFVIARDM